MNPYTTLKYPLMTEKSVRVMEAENKLIFVVDKKAKKSEIKKAIEEMFKVHVTKVNTLITSKGIKKAYIKLARDTPALDVATQLGLI